jgi:hypothetical protein
VCSSHGLTMSSAEHHFHFDAGHLAPKMHQTGCLQNKPRSANIHIPLKLPNLFETDQSVVAADCRICAWQFYTRVQCSCAACRLTLNPSPNEEEQLEQFMKQYDHEEPLLPQASQAEEVFKLDL